MSKSSGGSVSITKITIGLAILVGALLAPTTVALGSEFSAESEWNGRGEHQVVELGGIPGECKTIDLQGVSPKNAISARALVQPKYEGCSSEILLIKEQIKVETHNCEYEVFNAKGTGKYTSEASLVNCPTGIVLKFKSGCEVVIPEQTSSKAGEGQNLKTAKGSFESEATAGLGGFKYTASEKCKGLDIKSGEDGTYKGSAIIKGLIAVGSGGVTASPAEVKFGNITKGATSVVYTNEGATSWVVPTLEYTVIEGGAKSVKPKNGCAGMTVNPGEKCSVTLNYSVTTAENYLAEMKLGAEAPTVTVRAEA
jgi:hypothetical protein